MHSNKGAGLFVFGVMANRRAGREETAARGQNSEHLLRSPCNHQDNMLLH